MLTASALECGVRVWKPIELWLDERMCVFHLFVAGSTFDITQELNPL